MTTEQNKALNRKWAELINAKDLEGALALVSSDVIDHSSRPGVPTGVEGVRWFFNMQFAAFPDLHGTILDEIAEGDKVVQRLSIEGTNTGMFMGIPPTGKHAKWTQINIIRIANGKVVEHWGEVDTMGMMQQLGLVPPPQPAR